MHNFLRYVRRNAFRFGMVLKALLAVAFLWGAYFSVSLFTVDSNFAMGKHNNAGDLAGSVFWQLVIISLLVFIWVSVKSISPLVLTLICGLILALCRAEQSMLIALTIASLSAVAYVCGYFVFGRNRGGHLMPTSEVRVRQ